MSRPGRIVGILIVCQMVGGALVNGVLEAPLFGSPGFLQSAAPHAGQLGLAVLLGLATEALWIGIAVALFPVYWSRARSLALWLLSLAVVTLAVAVFENSAVLSMLSLSKAHATASTADQEVLGSARVIVASARNWAHYLGRISDGVTILVFYASLYRLALVPRAITAFGLFAVSLMLTSVTMPIFGHAVVFPMLAPLGLSQLILAIWLIVRGLADSPAPANTPLSA